MHLRKAFLVLLLLCATSCTDEKTVEKKQELNVTVHTDKARSVAQQTDEQSKKNIEAMNELEQPEATPVLSSSPSQIP